MVAPTIFEINLYKQNLNIKIIKTSYYFRGDFMQRDKRFSKREDMTKYGEFVCSTFHWLPIEKQKEQAKNMAKMTKDKKENK